MTLCLDDAHTQFSLYVQGSWRGCMQLAEHRNGNTPKDEFQAWQGAELCSTLIPGTHMQCKFSFSLVQFCPIEMLLGARDLSP